MRRKMTGMRAAAVIFAACMFVTGCQSTKSVSGTEQRGESGQAEYAVGQTDETEAVDTEQKGSTISETESEPETVSLVMAGDVLLHTPVAESGLAEDGSYHFDQLFSHVAAIKDADIALVNQEVIIGGEELGITGYPSFNAPYALGDALVNAGFDVILHATNHALDKGKNGLINCMNFWKTNYPQETILGIHNSKEEQDQICVYEKNGMKIAILNYTYGTNGISLPADMPYGVDLLKEDKVISDLKQAEELADFTVVCPHWGTEYEHGITDEQKYWTRIFAENGADLVIGTHPHVIEPVEWYGEKNDGKEMLVYYSLGNFVNWTSDSGAGISDRMVGGLAEVTLTRGEDGTVKIGGYGVEPVVAHVESGYQGVTAYPLHEYTEELAAKNEIRSQDAAFSLDYCKQLCNEIWPDIPEIYE